MAVFRTRKGRDIPLKGKAEKIIKDLPLPKRVGIQPLDFRGLKPRLAVKVGDAVKIGTPVLTDKVMAGVKVVSPASGKVAAINRGQKRALVDIVIEPDGRQDAEGFPVHAYEDIAGLDQQAVKSRLLDSGLWPVLRQRPFSKIAHPDNTPKAIFVHAMNTEPLAPDMDVVLSGKQKEFQAGLNALAKLTAGPVNLCFALDAQAPALTGAQNARIHKFSGPHPCGNVSTHIFHVDPIQKGDVVWYVEAGDVVRIGELFLTGRYPVEKIVAVTGESAPNRYYARTVEGAPIRDLLDGCDFSKARCISGSVLSGRNVGEHGFVGFYHAQVTAIPEGGKREFLGWLMPGPDKYTFSQTYLSALNARGEFSLDTGKKGSDRAIVLNHIYDDLITLEIPTYFLLRAIFAGDVDEAERLGILECDEEDFALCAFACPSKTEVGQIIRQGLNIIEKEE